VQLSPEEIATLVQRGEDFVAAGDLPSARLVFQRAAEAGDARAAMALAATYDPIALKRLGVVGISPDVEKARKWYEKAKEYGSTEAPRRIELLASWSANR
jgi:TPR repeat protein